MTKPQRKGPRATLEEGDPRVVAVKRALAAQGFKTFSAAAEWAGFDLSYLIKIVREGLPEDPRVRTVERLDKLGILELVRRAS